MFLLCTECDKLISRCEGKVWPALWSIARDPDLDRKGSCQRINPFRLSPSLSTVPDPILQTHTIYMFITCTHKSITHWSALRWSCANCIALIKESTHSAFLFFFFQSVICWISPVCPTAIANYPERSSTKWLVSVLCAASSWVSHFGCGCATCLCHAWGVSRPVKSLSLRLHATEVTTAIITAWLCVLSLTWLIAIICWKSHFWFSYLHKPLIPCD